MKSLISSDFLHLQHSQFTLRYPFPLLTRENRRFFVSNRRRKWLLHSAASRFCSAGALQATAVSEDFGGWDDSGFESDSDRSGQSDQVSNFLASIGISDRHAFAFFLGIVCASAIYRVRISSFLLFPASVLVFAVGFSFGFIRGGSIGELIVNGNKRKGREDGFRVDAEKLRILAEFLDDFDRQIGGLTHDIQRAIVSRKISKNDLEKYINVLEANSLSNSNGRKILGLLIDYGDNPISPMVENQKHRRKNNLGEIGSEILQSVGQLFGEMHVDPKPTKVKNHATRETGESGVNEKTERNGLSTTQAVDETFSSPVSSITDENQDKNTNLFQDSRNKYDMDQDGFSRSNKFPEIGKKNFETFEKHKRYNREYGYPSNRLQFTSNDRIFLNNDLNKGTERFPFSSDQSDPLKPNPRMKPKKIKASFVEEHVLEKSRHSYRSSRNMEDCDSEIFGSQFRDERMNQVNDSTLDDEVSSSSINYDDEVFNSYLTEANDLLKQAKGFMRNRHEEEIAEITLQRTAKILSKATAMKPTSLLAVGQLGNTYLLHGEMKLRITRELRNFLSETDHLSDEKWSRTTKEKSDKRAANDDLTSFLINVCEECEELLMEAGRKYRLALSIDSNDARALYNWGLALSFRAQLIADIGPEAAADADKIFMAAIDKFDSMLSIGNVYAPDALFRWGVALQQRSQLRPSDSKEKTKFLQQAKRLYEDALDLDGDNLQARKALLSCISELKLDRINKL